MIPRIIVQTGTQAQIAACAQCIDSLTEFAPEYERKFFSDCDIRNFLSGEYPRLLEIYDRLPLTIQRIDFFRYVAIYHFGGFYFDLDVQLLRQLDTALRAQHCVFPVDTMVTADSVPVARFAHFVQHRQPWILGQYAFGAVPRHRFLQRLICAIVDRCDEFVRDCDGTRAYVYRTTGPDFVTGVFLDTPWHELPKVLIDSEEQTFGDYGRHLHHGSWKAAVTDPVLG